MPLVISAIIYTVSSVSGYYAVQAAVVLCTKQGSTNYLATHAEKPRLDYNRQRNGFNDTPTMHSRKPTNHTHGEAAADRAGGSATLVAAANATGAVPYMIQPARVDQMRQIAGSRQYYTVKDMTTRPQDDDLPENAQLTMVDVDYYLDMPKELTKHFKPFGIYTFQPHAAAAVRDDNYSFSFDAHNNVHYVVSGGATYRHEVWNWQVDHVKVMTWKYYFFPTTVSYLVDRRAMSLDHELVFLTPTARWRGVAALYANWKLEGNPLERLKLNQGEFNVLQIRTPTEHNISVARPEQHTSATVPKNTLDTITNVSDVLKNDLTMPTAESNLVCSKMTFTPAELKQNSALIVAYVRSKCMRKAPTVFPIEHCVKRFQYGTHDPEAKPSLVAFGSSFVPDVYAPDRSVGNERKAIKGRIIDVRATNEKKIPEAYIRKEMMEFFERLLPGKKHTVRPISHEELYERMNRPAQRRQMDDSDGIAQSPPNAVKSFIKAEAYGEPKAPRIISTLETSNKVKYAKLIYGLMDLVKGLPCYAFGKTPLEVAEMVSRIAQNARVNLGKTDYSKMDGSINEMCRTFELMFMLFFLAPEFHNEAMDLHDSQHHLKAFCTFFTMYFTIWARNSGEMATSLFNTMINKFIYYLSCRKTIVNGRYMSADEAMAKTMQSGFGGDDGLVIDPNEKAFREVAAWFNQKAKFETVEIGGRGVEFLARIYSPDVWTGCLDSMCTPSRQFPKLFTTPCLPVGVTAEMKLGEKMRSYALTDSNTPGIGHIIARYKDFERLRDEPESALKHIAAWGSDNPAEDQYPNQYGDWMVHELELSIPTFNLEMLKDALNDSLCVEHLLHLPMCSESVELDHPDPVVINDESIGGPPVSNDEILPPRESAPHGETWVDVESRNTKRDKKKNSKPTAQATVPPSGNRPPKQPANPQPKLDRKERKPRSRTRGRGRGGGKPATT